MTSGYQAGGTPAQALVGRYCTPLDARYARLNRRYEALTASQKRAVDRMLPEAGTVPDERYADLWGNAISFIRSRSAA